MGTAYWSTHKSGEAQNERTAAPNHCQFHIVMSWLETFKKHASFLLPPQSNARLTLTGQSKIWNARSEKKTHVARWHLKNEDPTCFSLFIISRHEDFYLSVTAGSEGDQHKNIIILSKWSSWEFCELFICNLVILYSIFYHRIFGDIIYLQANAAKIKRWVV